MREIKTVYLDMNIYNRGFDDQSQLRIRLETIACQTIFRRIQDGELRLVWSFMLDYENSFNPFPERREEIVIMSRLAAEVIFPSDIIEKLTETLEAAGIKNKDAVHLACAESHGCSFFITCDEKLIKKAQQLQLHVHAINPVDFVRLETN